MATASAAIGASPDGSSGRRLKHVLPHGQTLPEATWRARHRVLLALLWSNAVALSIFGFAQGYDAVHSLGHGAVLGAFALAATLAGRRRRIAAALVSLGLVTASALLVHAWSGVIEAHFYFFVVIVFMALYEDWLPFLLAAAYVVLHHGLTGALDPGAVYNHADAVAHPWKWAAIHGGFVAAAGIGSVAAWRLNENVRAETQLAYRLARESEERFKGAFEGAPIGMALHGFGPEGHLAQVNRSLCDMTGYAEEELARRSLADLAHPDDAERSAAMLARLARGESVRLEGEHRLLHTDGHVIRVQTSASAVRDGSGNALYAICQIQDITDRKRAEEALAFEARHDALTGLPNRRSLMADLDHRIAAATREEPMLLVLFDLDGFKAYNDSYGHQAGDALLTRLGHNLATAMDGIGTAYRMGGDEFCLLAPVGAEGAGAVINTATSALSEHGQGFQISASFGSVLVPTDARDSTTALAIADQRMYARKSIGSRASAGRQATDALMRVLAERSPSLGVHLGEVAQLSRAVGDRLMLPEEQLAALLQAASLHDVGKAAIPDAILDKPGPLTADEWEFIRRHPVIGERILAAAPALTHAAKLVRASHERFDGRGYPDGMAGEDIPLGARIILVCDAYDAMTSNRPYRAAMSHEGAVAELRRGAGSQFDPLVVDVFLEVVAGIGKDDEAAGLLEGHGPLATGAD